jgi:hypothetical protein
MLLKNLFLYEIGSNFLQVTKNLSHDVRLVAE